MLTRSLDKIIAATSQLPDHVAAARRYYDHSPEAIEALTRLEDALAAVDRALLGRKAKPPLPLDDGQQERTVAEANLH